MSDATGTGSWTSINSGTAAYWSALGNVGTSTVSNFIGTTDNVPLVFKANNIRSGYLDPTAAANTFFGFQSGLAMTTGVSNVGIARGALGINTSGSYNSAVGVNA